LNNDPDEKLCKELEVLLKAYELIETEINEHLKNTYSVCAMFATVVIAVLTVFIAQNSSASNLSSYFNFLLLCIPYLILLLAACLVSHKCTLISDSKYGERLEKKINNFFKKNYDFCDELVTLEKNSIVKYKNATASETALIMCCSFIYLISLSQVFIRITFKNPCLFYSILFGIVFVFIALMNKIKYDKKKSKDLNPSYPCQPRFRNWIKKNRFYCSLKLFWDPYVSSTFRNFKVASPFIVPLGIFIVYFFIVYIIFSSISRLDVFIPNYSDDFSSLYYSMYCVITITLTYFTVDYLIYKYCKACDEMWLNM
jgi:hypothetical protein